MLLFFDYWIQKHLRIVRIDSKSGLRDLILNFLVKNEFGKIIHHLLYNFFFLIFLVKCDAGEFISHLLFIKFVVVRIDSKSGLRDLFWIFWRKISLAKEYTIFCIFLFNFLWEKRCRRIDFPSFIYKIFIFFLVFRLLDTRSCKNHKNLLKK